MDKIDPIMNVLSCIEILEWKLKDMHYGANDRYFNALHLLADQIDFGSDEDDLKEIYFLGFKNELPPEEKEIHALALTACPERPTEASEHMNEDLLRDIKAASESGISAVEAAKAEPGLPAGVHAVLDDVSKVFLKANGLCWRSLETDVVVDVSVEVASDGHVKNLLEKYMAGDDE